MQIKTYKISKYVAAFVVLCVAISAIWLPIYLTWFKENDSKSCPYLATPVKFQSAALKKITQYRSPASLPEATFSYTFLGKEYTSESVFCAESGTVQAERGRVQAFVKAAEKAEPIVAWVKPEKPDSGCISINSEFGYSTVNQISTQCLAK